MSAATYENNPKHGFKLPVMHKTSSQLPKE